MEIQTDDQAEEYFRRSEEYRALVISVGFPLLTVRADRRQGMNGWRIRASSPLQVVVFFIGQDESISETKRVHFPPVGQM